MTEQWFTFPIINEIAIEIGPIAIRWYALAYLAGIFTTMLLMNREAKKDSSAFEPEDITRLTNFLRNRYNNWRTTWFCFILQF